MVIVSFRGLVILTVPPHRSISHNAIQMLHDEMYSELHVTSKWLTASLLEASRGNINLSSREKVKEDGFWFPTCGLFILFRRGFIIWLLAEIMSVSWYFRSACLLKESDFDWLVWDYETGNNERDGDAVCFACGKPLSFWRCARRSAELVEKVEKATELTEDALWPKCLCERQSFALSLPNILLKVCVLPRAQVNFSDKSSVS